jgi:hypothetical protein
MADNNSDEHAEAVLFLSNLSPAENSSDEPDEALFLRN